MCLDDTAGDGKPERGGTPRIEADLQTFCVPKLSDLTKGGASFSR